MNTTGWPRCAEVAAAAGDRLEATAPPVHQWFLIEHPGPWGHQALSGSGIDPSVVTALSTWTRQHTGRVLLIRRPGRAAGSGRPRRWYRVDSRVGCESTRSGTFTSERELVEVVATPDEAGERFDGPLYLACTHGRHDTCCAVFGRPLAAVLAATELGHAYECSHIGGCRFAATLVALPHGYVFGRVSASEGVDIAHDYTRGRVRREHLRGRTVFSPAVQAAQHHARLVTGADSVDALLPVGTDELGDGRRRVALTNPDCTVELRERHVPAERPLTCSATETGWLRVFDLVDVRTVGGSSA